MHDSIYYEKSKLRSFNFPVVKQKIVLVKNKITIFPNYRFF
ncbi:hypothetical protein LEP1GSC043_1605 [Leptospira weilii str. Ecochallenge]|uniref:Uncharacterized protein n=1 Tax=Leptospira weilii str. Ecochallenge TaxID=1049986 RepID=N1U3G0_9LEPT|nr:hypothetical protein LEP1GSC043_1605 [Leptospira weilii str. Ecochallenge]